MLIPCSQPVAHDCRTPECSVVLLELLLPFVSEANVSLRDSGECESALTFGSLRIEFEF